MVAPGPVFISYSRKDFYFAESLAFHLERSSVPVWLDVKNLEPGADWEEQLEVALDEASCVVVVISGDSAIRPAVRMEWERARKKNKRIIVALFGVGVFRKTNVPSELTTCELVDFRSSFAGGLRSLIQKLAGAPADARRVRNWLPLPLWILTITLTLLIPLLCYFSLADWSSSESSAGGRVLIWIMMPFFVGAFFWLLCISFLRRRMGMTHLAFCFAFPAILCFYPLVRYLLAGPSHVPDTWLAVLQRNPMPMEIGSAVTLAGIAVVVLLRPDDLLRWTPTGKAWGFYRERCLARFAGADRPSALREVKCYTLLNDAADGPAAKCLRQELSALGATESNEPAADHTTILLLTSRTQTEWLNRQTDCVRSKVLTVVGTRIGLPEQLEWLWRREWIDFRHWDLQRLDRKRGLLQVPEAVTGIRYPAAVRVAHHLLCALTASAFCLLPLADPDLFKDQQGSQATPVQTAEEIICAAICVWCGILAQRLLNRSVAQPAFEKAWKIGLAATVLFAMWALPRALSHGVAVWRLLPFVAFWLACPFLLYAKRDRLTFWFPTPGISKPGIAARLKTGRQWQTLLWCCLYFAIFGFFAGMYKD